MIARIRQRHARTALTAALGAIVLTAPVSAATGPLAADTEFYVPKANHGAIAQIAQLTAAGDVDDARLIRDMVETPSAVWFTSGSPQRVQQDVKATVQRAEAKRQVPVLVAYNVPGRDCAQYSAGGAPTGDAYRAWIDGFAAGLGSAEAVVIVEPDGLALQPTDCGQPDTFDRVALINYAVDVLAGNANAHVYLDAGHSSWHNVGDIASRLVAGGVLGADGFYLNPSNYQFTPNLVHYGTWISSCIAFVTELGGAYGDCPNQYWNGGPPNWVGVALSPYGVWSDTAAVAELNTSGETARYASMLGSTSPTVQFVIDTSRNGVGPWQPPANHPAGDPQDWCNPPDRGTGILPTADTGIALLDAYLWIKIPGESDGLCYRWTSGPTDPVRDTLDPAAGQWFPDMALELARNAHP